jgi:hypothetical protein
MRVCQFRHDGNLELAMQRRPQGPPCQEDQHFYFTGTSQTVKPLTQLEAPQATTRYPSFAVIEIFAFSTFDTGQPFSAASAYF